jgi:hypothetical protein
MHLRLYRICFEPQIDEEIFEFELLCLPRLKEMDRLGAGLQDASKGFSVPTMNADALGDENAGVEASHRLHADKSLVVDMANQEADFVNVGGKGNAWASLSPPNANEISQGVNPQLIHQWLHVASDDIADPIFTGRNAIGLREVTQQGLVHR